jgi:hypothetical protein
MGMWPEVLCLDSLICVCVMPTLGRVVIPAINKALGPCLFSGSVGPGEAVGQGY